MAELDTLKSYLISLGFAVDIASYRKMNQLLDQQKKMVMNSTGMMSNAYVQAGKTIAGVLIGVGVATVTLMDKVAKADLGYDLFGMRMYMTADAAKKVKIAVDALGYSMDEIAWNPELKKRFDQLIELQGGLQGKLGPDYKQSMKEIRDIRFEFTKMKVEGEYMMQVLTVKLFQEFGIKAEDVHKALEKISNWMENTAIPAIVKLSTEISEMARNVSPILTTAFDNASKGASAFARELSAGASDRASFADWLGTIAHLLAVALQSLTSLVETLRGSSEVLRGIGNLNWKQVKYGASQVGKAGADWWDVFDIGGRGDKMLQEAADKAAGKKPVMKPYKFGPLNQEPQQPNGGSRSWGPTQSGAVSPGVSKFKDLLSQYFPGQEHVAAAIMKAESANTRHPQGDPRAHNPAGGGTGAFGLFQIRGQLHEQALKRAGIINDQKDLFDPEKNFQAARFLYDRGGWQPWNASRHKWGREVAGSTVTIGDVNVTVTGGANATASDIGKQAAIEFQKKMEDLDRRRRAREIREFGGVMG